MSKILREYTLHAFISARLDRRICVRMESAEHPPTSVRVEQLVQDLAVAQIMGGRSAAK